MRAIKTCFMIILIMLFNISVFAEDETQKSTDYNYWDTDDGIKLYHFSEGSGNKVLIIHGGPGFPSMEPWPGLDPLTDKYEFVYYDQRGCGKSTRPIDTFATPNFMANVGVLTSKLGLKKQLSDIERIREILGEEKLTIIGHSFGGFIATMYALEYRESVESMILVAPASMLVFPPPPEYDFFAKIKNLLPDSLHDEYDDFKMRFLDYANIFSKSEQDLIDLYDEMTQFYKIAADKMGHVLPPDYDPGSTGGWMPYGIYMSMGMSYDHRPKLKTLDIPVLVLHGANDIQIEQASKDYSDNIPNAEFKILDGAGHFMFYEKTDEFAKIIGEFLGKRK